MGGIIKEVDRQSDGKIDGIPSGAGTGTDRTSSDTSDTRTDRRGTGTGAGAGTDTGGNTEKGKPSEKVSELSLLTDEELKQYQTANASEQKRILRNAKRRQRYADQKAKNGEQVKPRKVNTAKKTETNAFDVTQLNLIIAGVSCAVASREGMSHWLLTEQEINSITVPLSKMLAESETFASMGQYSNQIALVMACLTVFAPRIFVTIQQSKEKKEHAVTGQHTNTNVRGSETGVTGKTKDSNTPVNRTDDIGVKKSHGSNDDKTVPWYGSALA